MNILKSFCLLFIFFTLSASCLTQTYPIGELELFMEDPDRNDRLVTAEIFYPALSEGSIFLAEGEFPMIVFAHGFVMPFDSYLNIRDHYVDKGYIVMFITTEGSFTPSHEDFALDINFMLEYIVFEGTTNTQSVLFDHFIPEVALMGHSMGGGASMLAANLSDHVKTVIGLAPAETDPSAIAASFLIEKPALIFSGSADAVTPASEHHLPIYDALSSDCKVFIDIIGGAHCYFANEDQACDLGELLSGGNIGISRAEQQEIMFEYSDAWLDNFLKHDDAGVMNLFQTDQNDSRVIINNDCEFTTSDDDIFELAIQVYPNPLKDIIYLKNNEIEREFKLYDSLGQLRKEGRVIDKIEVSNLDSQHYFLQLKGVSEIYKLLIID